MARKPTDKQLFKMKNEWLQYTLPLGEVRILHWHTLPMILF